jgi:hypothetical protein
MAIDPTQFTAPAPVAPVVSAIEPPEPIDISQAGAYDPQEISDYNPYTAEQADAQTSGDYTPYSAETAAEGAGQGDAITGDFNEANTVESRLSGLLSRNSDYMKRATTRADQESNRRGLLNSSIAVGAAHGAAIDASLPIAQQDSSAAQNLQLSNLGYENEMARLNTQNDLNLQQFNTGEINRAQYENTMAQIQNEQFNAEMRQSTELSNVAATNKAAQYNATRQTEIDMFNAGAENNAQTILANGINDQNFAQFSADLQSQLAELDNALAMQLHQMELDYGIQQNLDSIEGAIYTQLVTGIASILEDQDDPAAAASIIEIFLSTTGGEFDYIASTGEEIGSTVLPSTVDYSQYSGMNWSELMAATGSVTAANALLESGNVTYTTDEYGIPTVD